MKELYGVEVSPTLVSEITEDLDAEVQAWQTRRLDAVWPIVFLDGIVVHIRGESGHVREHTMYVAIGVNFSGKKEHLVRAALKYVTDADSRAVVADLKKIYQAATVLEAEQELERFAATWDEKYPTISKQWRLKWPHIVTMFELPAAIRRAVYTTSVIESVNSVIRPCRISFNTARATANNTPAATRH